MGPVFETAPVIMQAFTTLALVAAASQYHPAPLVHAVAGYPAPDLAEPSPYTYQYAVADDYSGAAFSQGESNDGTGAVSGSYSVNLPDGRIQTVTYNANDLTGNIATVEYSGVAAYPEAHAVAHPVVHAVAHRPVVHAVAHHAPVLAHGGFVGHHGLAHGGLVHHG